MWKTELKIGIIGGILLCVFKTIEYLWIFQTIRVETGIYTGLFAYVIVIAVVILGVKMNQNGEDDAPYTFREAFRSGMIIVILMAFIATTYVYVHGRYANPNEVNRLIQYASTNGGPITKDEIQFIRDDFAHRPLRTGAGIIITGLFVSLFSAAMFRRIDRSELDPTKKEEMPSVITKLFLLGLILAFPPMLVYISWVLKAENITTLLFDFIIEPIDGGVLQAGTALFSLGALMVNGLVYNKISIYSHRRQSKKMWSVLIMIVSGTLFFISLCPVL
jgi:hypothetical protein